MRRVAVGLLSALGALALSSPVLADEAKRVDAQVILLETYDANVARSNAALAAERGIVQQDEIFSPSLSLDLRLPISRQLVFLKGLVGYDLYAHNHVLNNGRIDLQGGVETHVRGCKGRLADDYARHQSDLQELSLVATRNVEQLESITFDGDCGGEIGFAPTLSVAQHWDTNSAPQLITSDYNSFSGKAGVAYRRPTFGELWLYGVYDNTQYPHRGLSVGLAEVRDGYKDYGVGLQYDRRLGARIQTTLKAAYISLHPNVRSLAEFNGVTYGADVSFRISSRLQTRLTLDRSVLPVDRPDITYAIQNSYLAAADYAVGPRLKLSLGISDETDRYRGAALISDLDIAHENIWAAFGSLGLQVGRRFALKLDARHENRNANISAFSYSDDRVGLSLAAAL